MIGKEEFVKKFAKNLGETQVKAKEIFEVYWKTIKDTLEDGEEIQFQELGTFLIVNKPENKRRNPRTNEAIVVPEKDFIKFKISKKLRNLLVK